VRLRVALVVLAAAAALPAAGANGAAPPTPVKLGPVAHLTTDGKSIWVPVQFQCALGQIVSVKTLIFEGVGGALSPGAYAATCTGKLQHGAFKVTPKGKKPHLFKVGAAQGCWFRTLKTIKAYTDLQSGCNALTVAKPT
jgi:hypothetical protein